MDQLSDPSALFKELLMTSFEKISKNLPKKHKEIKDLLATFKGNIKSILIIVNKFFKKKYLTKRMITQINTFYYINIALKQRILNLLRFAFIIFRYFLNSKQIKSFNSLEINISWIS